MLITSRDIITLWVARMVLTGLHNVGEVPFHDVFIHPKILDGYGEGMSKSKGNGVDPIDVIEKFGADSLRFGLAYLTTETQDVRMPVEFECPHCQKLIEQTQREPHAAAIKCKHCGKQFSTQWAEKPEDKALPRGAVVSERFELARNFCNKLWNASRFALMNLDGFDPGRVADDELLVEDSWILSRLATVTEQVTDALAEYRFADAARALYDFAWDEFCSFYVEMVKGRLQDESAAGGRPAGVGPHARHAAAAAAPDDSVPDRGGLAAAGRGGAGAGHRRGRGRRPRASCWPPGPRAIRPGRTRRSRPSSPVSRKCSGRCATSAPGRAWRRRRRSRSRSVATRRSAELLRPMEPYFALDGQRPGRRPSGRTLTAPALSANVALPGMDVYVDLAELIDVPAEIARKKQEVEKLTGFIAAKEKKLTNANFVDRAPAEVVQKERDSLKDLQDQLAAAQEVLERLAETK